MKRFQFKHLRAQLTLAMMLVSLIPLAVVISIVYVQRSAVLRSAAISKLEGIRDIKVSEVHSWIQERQGDVRVLAGDSTIRATAKLVLSGDNSAEALQVREGTRGHLEDYIRELGDYEEFLILDPASGKVGFSSSPEHQGEDWSSDEVFQKVKETGKPFIKDIFIPGGSVNPVMFFSEPVFSGDAGGALAGILVVKVDPAKKLYGLLLNRAGMGETGESLLVNKDVIALSTLRWREGAPLTLRLRTKAAESAARGDTATEETLDYRGVQVVVAYTHIDEMDWGFVVKQDVSEIYANVYSLMWQLVLLFVLAVIAAAVLSFYLAGTIVRPVVAMTTTAAEIQRGNLSARNMVDLKNELGVLAKGFNDMAAESESLMIVLDAIALIRDSMGVSTDLPSVALSMVKQLSEITGANLSVFYMRAVDGKTFEHLASVGANPELLQPFDASISEGDIGRAVALEQIVHVKDLPSDIRFAYRTASGPVLPVEMLTIPLMAGREVHAVVALASVQPFAAEHVTALRRAWPSLNIAMANLISIRRTSVLAQKLRVSNTELEAQAQELKAQTMELDMQRLQVEEADRLKSEFLSNMSHELRTPLNSVITLSELMVSRGPGKNPEKDNEYLRIIQQNGYHLLNLINDILDLSKIEAGHMEVVLSEFDPGQVLERAVETTQPLAAKKNLHITLQGKDMPTMRSDGAKVYQILLNLLSNAVKFTQAGRIDVTIGCVREKIVFTVKDTGIGIPAGEIQHVFDQFRQVDGSTTRQHEGTGLGLAICQRLAKLLGGTIDVESIPGAGSTFRLTLPLSIREISGRQKIPAAKAPEPSAQEPVAVPKGLTVLVVDDEPEACNLLRTALEFSGYTVITANNGADALRLALEHQPFAITLDVLMPDMDGWEVLGKLKSSDATQDIPAIIVSVSKDIETGLALGASAFVPKPIAREMLLREIARLARWRTIRNILVVDDDSVAREHFSAILEERGYRVVAVSGGSEALASVASYMPDAVVLDLMMPEVDGFSVLASLRAEAATHDLPVIVVTAKDLTPLEKQQLTESTERLIGKGVMQWNQLVQEVEASLLQIELQVKERAGEGRPRVLVVEDNETAVLQIRTALEENGCEVIVAPGGEQALASFSSGLPDVVVLDLMMPGVDGFEVLERIRSTPWTSRVPVVVLTAKELTAADSARLTHNNVQALIQKGAVQRDELVARVKAVILRQPAPPSTVASALPVATANVDNSRLVLVVEDNPDNTFTITEILEIMEIPYAEATDGIEALEMAHKLHPGLILMDIQMPRMSGLEAARELRGNPEFASIPLIAMTAKAMRGDKEEILAGGFDECLIKPLVPQEVLDVIRKWIPVA